MKTVFAALIVACFACTSFAGEPTPAAAEPQSVVVAAPAPAVTACETGNCCTESSCRQSCRHGLFGRTIERTRTVTRAVVEVPVRVVTAPVRVFRARRGCCCQ